jgi:hypothetical protein
MADEDLPADADALYGLPFEEFVPARGALAKRLRGEGDRDAAKRVQALRKPSVAAWTINQLVRSRGADVAAFTQAAERLRDAQADLLEGRGSAGDLREARTAERESVARLVEIARGLFPGGREPGETTLERIAATLHAAAADEEVRAEVLSGRLLTEREPSGFGDLEVALPAAPREGSDPSRKAPARRGSARRKGSDPGRAERERREAEERERAERERRERRIALQAALDAATKVRERAEEALAAAREEERRLREALDELG